MPNLKKGSFEYDMAFQLSYMMDRSELHKSIVSKVLKLKNHILNDEPLDDEERNMINRILDDHLIINEICKNSEGFGKFLYCHADLDAYLPTTNPNSNSKT